MTSLFLTDTLFMTTSQIRIGLACDKATYLNQQVISRVASFTMAPLSALGVTVDTLVGMISGVGAIFTAGTNKKIWSMASNLTYSRHLLNLPYLNLLRTINPQANIRINADGIIFGRIENSLRPYLEKSYLKTLRSSESNFLNREITSRISYLLFSLVTIVIRAVDGLIGLIASTLSLVMLGTNATINTLAFNGLASTGIVYDLFYCAVKIINPNAGIFSYD